MPTPEALILSAAIAAIPTWIWRRGGPAAASWSAAGTLLTGAAAWRWDLLAGAFHAARWPFAVSMTRFFVPVLLAATLALILWASVGSDFRPARPLWTLGPAAAWMLTAGAAEWRMRAAYGYGPGGLAEAAGISAAGASRDFGVIILAPRSSRDALGVRRRRSWGGVDLSPAGLAGLSGFLARSQYRGIHVPDALDALRRGWLLRWDHERALAASSMSSPGRIRPDWLQALALMRAGPLNEERRILLDSLAALAEAGAGGFEQVGQSQRIFEAFSAAYARFGDEEESRRWLTKVDTLWPLYEKRIEATPVEYFKGGKISGSVDVEGGNPGGIRIGLFYVSGGTRAYEAFGDLAAGSECAPDGSFSFSELGEGRYYLAIGSPDFIGARARPVPGLIVLSGANPARRLEPIRIEYPPSQKQYNEDQRGARGIGGTSRPPGFRRTQGGPGAF